MSDLLRATTAVELLEQLRSRRRDMVEARGRRDFHKEQMAAAQVDVELAASDIDRLEKALLMAVQMEAGDVLRQD